LRGHCFAGSDLARYAALFSRASADDSLQEYCTVPSVFPIGFPIPLENITDHPLYQAALKPFRQTSDIIRNA